MSNIFRGNPFTAAKGGGGSSLPSLAFGSAVSQAEGASGTTTFTFTLNLTRNGSTAVIPYTWAVTGSGPNPANGADFPGDVLPSGSGTFAPDETSKSIVVNVKGDSGVEPDEGFTVTATASLPIGSVAGTGLITNDDTVSPPTADWRLPILNAYSSIADATFTAALIASGTAKTLPVKTAAIPASTTWDGSLLVDTVAAPGGFIYLDWQQTGTGLVAVTVFESTDSTDGSAGSGTWTANSFTLWKPSGDSANSGYTGRGQLIRIAAGASRWVRVRIVTPASTTAQPYLGAFQLKADGSHDLWAITGMSIVYQNLTSRNARAAIMAAVPGSDPICITTARSGADQAAILTEQFTNGLSSHAQFAGGIVRTLYGSWAINDVAYAANKRPYSTDPDPSTVATRWQAIYDAALATVGGTAARMLLADISFGNFTTADTASNAAPYVNGDVNSANGFLPYNQYQVGPKIKANDIAAWNTAYDWPLLADYAGNAIDWENYLSNVGTGDSLHNQTAGATAWQERFGNAAKRIYALTAADPMVTILDQVGAKATAAMKSRLNDVMTAMTTMYPTSDATAVSNRSAMSAAISAIMTTFSDPSVTAPAILPNDPGIASGTLVMHYDAGEFTKITRDVRGRVASIVDRKNAYTMASAALPAGYATSPVLTPELASGAKARMRFNSSALQYLSSSAAGLVGLLDAGAVPFTFFAVIELAVAAGASGGDVFGIGSGSQNFFLVSIQPNGFAPRFLIGDVTGSAYSLTPTDAALAAGTRFAFAFRRDAAGNLKYYRGGVTATGTTSKNTAVTGTLATIGKRAQGSAAFFNGSIFTLPLFTGDMTDAEISNVLAGLRQKWTGPTTTCV